MSGRSGETARVVHVKLDINMCRISDIDKRPDQGREEDSDEREKRERKIRKVKRRLRSEISVSGGDWQRRRVSPATMWASPRGPDAPARPPQGHPYTQFAAVPRLLSTAGLKDRIPRVHIRDITMHEFVERFEKPRLPVILLGLCDDWPAYRKWSLDWFRDRYGESKFKLGTDDDGYAVRMKFKYYFSYLKDPVHAADDSPLYVFEGSFGDRAALAGLQDDYSVPEIFAEDLMQHVGERRRPPYKWVVIGPPRSGACLHVDPLRCALHVCNSPSEIIKALTRCLRTCVHVSTRGADVGSLLGELAAYNDGISPRLQHACVERSPPGEEALGALPAGHTQSGPGAPRHGEGGEHMVPRRVSQDNGARVAAYTPAGRRPGSGGDDFRPMRVVARCHEPGRHGGRDAELRLNKQLCGGLAMDPQGATQDVAQVAGRAAEGAPRPCGCGGRH